MEDLDSETYYECESEESGYYSTDSLKDYSLKDSKSQTQNYLLEIKQLKIENEILKQKITARDIELRNIESKNKENLRGVYPQMGHFFFLPKFTQNIMKNQEKNHPPPYP